MVPVNAGPNIYCPQRTEVQTVTFVCPAQLQDSSHNPYAVDIVHAHVMGRAIQSSCNVVVSVDAPRPSSGRKPC